MLRSPANDWKATVGRCRSAARVAGITSAGAALMAALQISDPLGLTLLLSFGAPETAFSVTAGVAFLAFAALLQWLGLALAGSLVTWPIAHLSLFIILSIVTSYLIYARPELGRLWIWIQVPVLVDFFMVELQPGGLGADNIQMFAGLSLAIALLLLCNRLLWPRSASITLRESTATMLDDARHRLATLPADLTGHDGAGEWNRLPASRLGYHLSLLGTAIRQAPTLGEAAAILSRVIRAERVRDAIEEQGNVIAKLDGRQISAAAVAELTALGEGAERLLEENALREEASATDEEYERQAAERLTIAERAMQLGLTEPPIAVLTELMSNIAQIVALNSLEQPAKGASWPAEGRKPPAASKRFLVRFSIRHTLALTIAFLIGLWDNSAALHAALWLLMLGGPPSHGATARKFTIRALGSAGALWLAVVGTAILTPNYGSLLPYAITIFVGTLPLAYIAESGGIISYLSIGGTAFVIAFSGPGPRPDLVGSIWTIWGISLGMIIRAVVSAFWQEHPGRTLAEQFQAPLESILLLLSDNSDQLTATEAIAEAEQQLVYGLEQILAVASDAKLEGASAAIDATSLIAAADTLLRIGFLVGNAKSLSNEYSVIQMGQSMESLRKLCAFWLDYLRGHTDSGISEAAPLRAMVLASWNAGLRPIWHKLDDMYAQDTLISFQSEVELADKLRHLLQTHFHNFEWQITHIAREGD